MPGNASDGQLSNAMQVLQSGIDCDNPDICPVILLPGWGPAVAPFTSLRSTRCGRLVHVRGRAVRTGASLAPGPPRVIGRVCPPHRTNVVLDITAIVDLPGANAHQFFRGLQQPIFPVAGSAGNIVVDTIGTVGIPNGSVVNINYTYLVEDPAIV